MSSRKKQVRHLEEQVKSLQHELQQAQITQQHSSEVVEIDSHPCELNKTASLEATFVGKKSDIRPASFRGSASEDWLIWLRNYEQVASLNKWPADFKLARLPTVLEGEANLKYWECSNEERSEWGKMMLALSKKFAPESNRATFQAALESCQRSKDETLDEFMSKVKTLARKAFPEWDEKYRDIMVKKYFVDGLDGSFRMWVLQANPQSADEALQIALRTEANMRNNVQPSVSANAAQVGQVTNTTDLAEAIAIALEKRGVGQQNEASSDRPRGRGRGGNFRRGFGRGTGRGRAQSVVCHSCGQTGHYWRDAVCPNAPRFQGNEDGAARFQGNEEGAGGHW